MNPLAKPVLLPMATAEMVGPRKSGIAVITFADAAVWPANAPKVTPTFEAAIATVATASSAAHFALCERVTVVLFPTPDRAQLEHEEQRERRAEQHDEQALLARV